MAIIPLSEEPNYSQVTTLGGIGYLLKVRWNTDEEAWYLTIANTEGDAGCTVKLLQGMDLLKPHSSSVGMPKGELWFVGEVGRRCTYNDVGEGGAFNLLFIAQNDGSMLDFLL